MAKSKQAQSINNVRKAKFTFLDFEGEYYRLVGRPERTGTHVIMGDSKNGKTTFAMLYAKYLSGFDRVAYDSIEEGLCKSIQMAMDRVNMWEVGSRVVLYDKIEIEDLIEKLDQHKSPNIVFIDSIQFAGMTFKDYKRLKLRYPHKLFVYISHVQNGLPDGKVAKRIYRDASVVWRVEGFRAIPTSRYAEDIVTDGDYLEIWKEGAERYWGKLQ
mgnify:CR=1 FL=1